MRRKGKVVDMSGGLEVGQGRYTAVYERDESGVWTVHVPEVPGCHTWGETLRQARSNLRDALSLWVDDAATAEIADRVELPRAVAAAVERCKAARARLERDQQEASRSTEEAAHVLVDELGMGLRDAGDLLDLSFQRVQQVVHSHKRRAGSNQRASSGRAAATARRVAAKRGDATKAAKPAPDAERGFRRNP
jgi:predicted RNase H-like HicB family nuclease